MPGRHIRMSRSSDELGPNARLLHFRSGGGDSDPAISSRSGNLSSGRLRATATASRCSWWLASVHLTSASDCPAEQLWLRQG